MLKNHKDDPMTGAQAASLKDRLKLDPGLFDEGLTNGQASTLIDSMKQKEDA